MRFGAVAAMTLFVAVGFVTFTPACNLIETRSDAGNAAGGNADPPTSAGGSASGGTSKASGGSGGSAGSAGSGGTMEKGGSSGSSAEGGDSGSGGASASGGAADAGGATAQGGASGVGGRTGAGGTAARGGAGGRTTATTTVDNCTDIPPPDQDPTCAEWASYGMCSQSWFATYCDKSCGRCTGTSNGGSGGGTAARGGSGGSAGGSSGSGGTTAKGGSGGGGGVTGPGTTNPQISGTDGFTTRYWDCCKPSCGWTGNSNPPVPSCGKDGTTRVGADARSGCEGGGTAFECYDFAPWYDPATNMSYGFAAKNGVTCGACFMLQFTGSSHNGGANEGAAKLKGQQMVVQAINIGGIEQNQFDLLIPGGGVGLMTQGCTSQWGNVDLGDTYGGLLSECKGDPTCMKQKCQSVFGNIPAMKAGCDWFTGWFSSADNPNLVYKQVSCPQQITSKTGLSK